MAVSKARLLGVVLILLGMAVAPAGVSVAADGLFGSREIRNTDMKAFTQWTEMWRRFNLKRQSRPDPPDCDGDAAPGGDARVACKRQNWEDFIEAHKGADRAEMLSLVNRFMNQAPYIVDPVNWGIPDYWATPREFFLKDGDCEDYAISKYITLKRLGVPADTMRLVVLQDENLNAAHAVLAVRHEGQEYILDNQVDQVVADDDILHYRPVYSINESAWWLHQRKSFGR
ncbi:transglutaminase-like cysteine peptidase [Yunchengibacter salinarum]|uniref:transglutaminase-like cysteine peptidase n=1 Tax=Yunchengibacter salinarum TaxID=3133399 RepID=UPI0035B69A12